MILDSSKETLYSRINSLRQFLEKDLQLELHPNKIILKKLRQGIDFCGYTILLHHRKVRTNTKRRIFKRVSKTNITSQSLQSYLGHFSHANSYKIGSEIKNTFFLTQKFN